MCQDEKKNRRIIYFSIIVSILIHILGLILLNYETLLSSAIEQQTPISEPLELVFEQTQSKELQPKLPDQFYELVENPNATGDIPKASGRLSTESSLSQAPVIQPGELHAIPGEETESINKSSSRESGQEESSDSQIREAVENALLAYKESHIFNRSALTGKIDSPKGNTSQEEQTEEAETLGESSLSPKGFNADLVGDFALSTYSWNWAPYWLAFKRKLLRVWMAPPAYYQLGLIHGYTIVRLKVDRQGNMTDLKVLQQVGHQSLQQSSVNALYATFPFKPLPEDFPDEYLEVTIKMVYPDLRRLRAYQ